MKLRLKYIDPIVLWDVQDFTLAVYQVWNRMGLPSNLHISIGDATILRYLLASGAIPSRGKYGE